MGKQAAECCGVKANTHGISCNLVLLVRNLELSTLNSFTVATFPLKINFSNCSALKFSFFYLLNSIITSAMDVT